MEIKIELKMLLELVMLFIGLTLILRAWYPPIHKSRQAIIILFLGVGIGAFLNPTKDGITAGAICSQLVFWGEDFFKILNYTQSEIKNTIDSNQNSANKLKEDKDIQNKR